jgi:hypothetical protein
MDHGGGSIGRALAFAGALLGVTGALYAGPGDPNLEYLEVRFDRLAGGASLSEADVERLSELTNDVLGAVAGLRARVGGVVLDVGSPERRVAFTEGILTVPAPYDQARRAVVPVRLYRESLIAQLRQTLRDEGAIPVPIGLTLVSVGVSFIPWVGEGYDAACLAAGRDLLTRERFTRTQMVLAAAGLASGVGSGALFAKLSRSRIVVLTQHLSDVNGACRMTEEGIRASATGLRRFRFKFVSLDGATPAEIGTLIRSELAKGRTVVVNAHGTPDGVLAGSTAADLLRNDDLPRLVGENLGGRIYDASCFSATRRADWERVVGSRGRVLSLKDPRAVDLVPGTVEVLPRFADGRLGSTYDFYVDGLPVPFLTYAHGPGR